MRFKEFRIVEADAGETDPDNPTQGELDDIAGAKSANETLRSGPPYPPEEMDAVKAMQSRLEELGYSVGSTGVDGKYGPRTTRAVRAFKKDNNISTPANEMSGAELEKLKTAEKVSKPTSTSNSRFDPRVATGDPDFEAPGYPEGMTRSDIESIIREEAKLRGIDPDVAVRIFRAEGASGYQSTVRRSGRGSLGGREASFGPYQLFIGGGLGNEYQERTGRDLTQDNTEDGITNQIRFALDMAVTQSWQPWYGRIPAGVGRRDGLEGAKQVKNWG